MRDYVLLEAALGRPRVTAFRKDAYPDLDAKAAALLHSVRRNRALIDGTSGWRSPRSSRSTASTAGARRSQRRGLRAGDERRPLPGRMAAFPGWLPHSVQATATGDKLRICIAWNVAYDKTWSPGS